MAIVFCQAFANADLLSNAIKNYNGPLWLIIDPMADAQLFKDKLNFVSKVGRPQSLPVKAKYNPDFGLFKLSKETESALAQLPTVNIFTGATRVNGTFENLFIDPQGKPLATFGNVDNKKIVLFSFSGLWDWRVADYKQNKTHKHVDELIQITTQYLTANDNGNRLKLRYEKRIPSANSLKIAATVYDATFTESTNASVALELKNESEEVLTFNFTQNTTDYDLVLPSLKPGKYTFNAIAKLGEEVLKTSGAFFVESQSLEQMNTRANYQLLAQLSGASGGAFYTASNLNALHVDINNNPTIKPIEKIKTESIALVDLKWMFYLTLVFFAAEWALRRYFGKI